MTTNEAKEFMKRIKSHYQEFVIDDFKFKEWYKELSRFDADDVNSKFDEHLKSEIYGEQVPKLYFLTKYLIPTSEKGKVRHYTVRCQECGAYVSDEDYSRHITRCLSQNTLMRDMKKYFNMSLDFEELTKLNDFKFNELYQRYCEKMIQSEKVPDFQKKILLRVLYPDEQLDITGLLNDLTKGLKQN